ncbi:MAG: GSCFA domain-containing protein [Flavobacteriaceae bacterium]|nr:MAG: GSCFA domain-containing protein [Flavobacteriaceae bacterium]
MKWRTEVSIRSGSSLIGYDNPVLLLGSCFATNLSEKLSYYQFPCLSNPFGVLFHPLPMENLVGRALNDRQFTAEDLLEVQGRWVCLETHSTLSGESPEEALRLLNRALKELKQALEHSTHTVLTLGTSFGFRHLHTGQLVANCHKLPGGDFERELSSPEVLKRSLSRILSLLQSRRSDMICLLTVSPVRHIRDGLVENQRSKAHLITAVQDLVQNGTAEYFPSYEIFMDELRDYRYYDRDLIHPSEVAVDYVWERFEQAWISPEARPVMKEVASVRKSLAHRPLHGITSEYQKFQETVQAQIQKLQDRFPHMDFGNEGSD